MSADKTKEGLRSGPAQDGILGQIFGKDDLLRMERLHRVARCRAIVAEMITGGNGVADAENLAVLRHLLRAEYASALADYIHGSGAAHSDFRAQTQPESAPKKLAREPKQRSILAAIKGALSWTR